MHCKSSMVLLFLYLCPFSVSCSTHDCVAGDDEFLELTPQSLARFATRLRDRSADKFIATLREHVHQDDFCKCLCLKYLVGSVVVFGQADLQALYAIRGLCEPVGINKLSGLLDALVKDNRRGTLVEFVTQSAEFKKDDSLLGEVIASLAKSDWHIVKRLVMEIIAILREDEARRYAYCFMLRTLPVKLQYKLINSQVVPLALISEIYHTGAFDPLLREIFFLGRCSRNPNLQIRNYVATKCGRLKDFLADQLSENAVASCPIGEGNPDAHVWTIILPFLDVETLVLVLPSVCTSWRRLHSSILLYNASIQDMYLRDLRYVKLSHIHEIAPWKYCLPDGAKALKYLGWCIAGGALGKLESTPHSRCELMGLLEGIVTGEIPPPVTKRYASPRALFLKLFDAVHKFCATERPILVMPAFFTEADYDQAIHHFVYENRWMVGLPKQWIANNLPRLFNIIKENEGLMTELIISSYGDFMEASIALIVHGQTNAIPERLARLIFSQTDLFKRFVEPECIDPGQYYGLIADHDMLPELVICNYSGTGVYYLTALLILSLKNDRDRIGKMVAVAAKQAAGLTRSRLEAIRVRFEKALPEVLKIKEGCSFDDARFVVMAIAQCGLLSECHLDVTLRALH